MTFGQASGPPASHQQLRRLIELVEAAGHTDFRDARGPLHLTQRQAAGKFTRDEAERLIVELESDYEFSEAAPSAASQPRLSRTDRAVRALPDEALAAELQRRGWVVMEP